jgi:hypothetical protein
MGIGISLYASYTSILVAGHMAKLMIVVRNTWCVVRKTLGAYASYKTRPEIFIDVGVDEIAAEDHSSFIVHRSSFVASCSLYALLL